MISVSCQVCDPGEEARMSSCMLKELRQLYEELALAPTYSNITAIYLGIL